MGSVVLLLLQPITAKCIIIAFNTSFLLKAAAAQVDFPAVDYNVSFDDPHTVE